MTSRTHRVFLGVVNTKKIGLEILFRVSQRGEGLYCYIPQDICNVFGLLPGDRLQVKIVARHRLVSGVELDKTEAAKVEKVEGVLVAPRQRRKRRKRSTRGLEKDEEELFKELEE